MAASVGDAVVAKGMVISIMRRYGDQAAKPNVYGRGGIFGHFVLNWGCCFPVLNLEIWGLHPSNQP